MKNVMRIAWPIVLSLVFFVIVGCTTVSHQTGAVSWQEVISKVKHHSGDIDIFAFYKTDPSNMVPRDDLKVSSRKAIEVGFVVVYKNEQGQIKLVFLDMKRPLKIVHTISLKKNSRLY